MDRQDRGKRLLADLDKITLKNYTSNFQRTINFFYFNTFNFQSI